MSSETHRVEAIELPPHDVYPGNARLLPLLYRGAFSLTDVPDGAALIERTFHANGWHNGWRDTVYDYHHYHSTAHEVLGCYRGDALVQLGGDAGPSCELRAGDVLLLPAGTAHKRLRASADFQVVGCYAEGRSYDMLRGSPEERAMAERRIAALPLPARDPVWGNGGPLQRFLARG